MDGNIEQYINALQDKVELLENQVHILLEESKNQGLCLDFLKSLLDTKNPQRTIDSLMRYKTKD